VASGEVGTPRLQLWALQCKYFTSPCTVTSYVLFELAGLARRYFCTEYLSGCGAPLRNLALIALMSDAMGRLHKLWCEKFTLLVLLVCVWEKLAVSTTGLQCALLGLIVSSNGVVFAILLGVSGRVHKSLVGSLYPR
jgi:hypothetical protein